MSTETDRVRVALRLKRAEEQLQRAIQEKDGSPESRTRYAAARAELEAAEVVGRALLAGRLVDPLG